MRALDYLKSIEIAPGVFWVRYNFEQVAAKLKQIFPIADIKHIILQHQGPNLCDSASMFERLADLAVYIVERTSIFAKFYGIKSFVDTVRWDGEALEFGNNRKFRFYMTPYCNSPGVMITYDEKTGIIFSSDIFCAFNKHCGLYADMYAVKHAMKRFMQPYMASKETVLNFIREVRGAQAERHCDNPEDWPRDTVFPAE